MSRRPATHFLAAFLRAAWVRVPRARRALVIALALMLPAQFTWAAAATYCEHENSPAAAWHFGHHVHHHSDEAGKAKTKYGLDGDCGVCHAAHAQAPTPYATAAHARADADRPEPASAPTIASAPLGVPDRPNWIALA